MQLLSEYENISKLLVKEFTSKYYDSTNNYLILGNNIIAPHSVKIELDFWSLSDIYVALKHNISKDILNKRYNQTDIIITLFDFNIKQLNPM